MVPLACLRCQISIALDVGHRGLQSCITTGYASKQEPNSCELVVELEGHMLCHFLHCNETTSVVSNEPLKGYSIWPFHTFMYMNLSLIDSSA
eukprot:5818358-Ditylum_brightwellii.AAC.1